jgi:hypothetical protein
MQLATQARHDTVNAAIENQVLGASAFGSFFTRYWATESAGAEMRPSSGVQHCFGGYQKTRGMVARECKNAFNEEVFGVLCESADFEISTWRCSLDRSASAVRR